MNKFSGVYLAKTSTKMVERPSLNEDYTVEADEAVQLASSQNSYVLAFRCSHHCRQVP